MFFWAVEMAQRGKKKGPKTLSSNPQNLHKSQMHRAKGQKQENSKKLKGKKKKLVSRIWSKENNKQIMCQAK